MSGRVRVVLVEPQEAGNVGAVARAMKNFGLRDLVIVGGMPEAPQPFASWWASGAGDVLEGARIVQSIPEALVDVQLSVATSSSRGRSEQEFLTPGEVGQKRSMLSDEQTLALVFGREDSGLTNRETSACQYVASIPTSPEFPTMNLAQSVAVMSYEITRMAELRPQAPSRSLASGDAIHRLHTLGQRLLLDVGFLHPENPDHIYDDIRALTARAMLDDREATFLMGIMRQISWRVQARSAEDPDPTGARG